MHSRTLFLSFFKASSANSMASSPPSAPPAPESSAQHDHPFATSPSADYTIHRHSPSSMSDHRAECNFFYRSSGFPPGTNPDVIRSFQMVDKDQSGYIDENELQLALSSGYQRFNIRTIRLLMFLFKNPFDALRIGPNEFAALWNCLGEWRAIFEKYDKDKSGRIDFFELREALLGLGYAIPPSVLLVLYSKYDDGSGKSIELNFDSFIECGMIVKGLTEKFKEKDLQYTGIATFKYDQFMSMVIPFLVSYD